jgi:hypothetical protein
MSQPTAEWSNTRIVAECLAGNEHAWSALLDRYKNLIYSIPLRYGAPPRMRPTSSRRSVWICSTNSPAYAMPKPCRDG